MCEWSISKKVKRCVCVCIFFLGMLLNKKIKNEFNTLIYMLKYLKDR